MSEPITLIQKPADSADLPIVLPDFELTMHDSDSPDDLFLAAWKRAIRLSGHPGWFGAHDAAYLDRAYRIDQLQPRVKAIAKEISAIPLSQACLVAAMVGFFNPAEGARLASRIDANGIGDISRSLSRGQRVALALMVVNYQGW